MAQMSNSQKKELARQLFLNTSKTQKEIAKDVGVTTKTMSNWAQDWKRLKAATESTTDKTRERLMRSIDYILNEAEKEDRAITDKEADKISKLNKALEGINKGVGLSEYIQVFMDFNQYLLSKDGELAAKFSSYQEQFINIKASGE